MTSPARKKVMIVEEDKETRRLLKRIFSKKGFDVVEMENGADCLTEIHNEKPCLVLLDRCMPDMDGWEVLRRIKEDDRLSSIKVAMLSSISPTTEDIMREEFDLLEDYVLKPRATSEHMKRPGNR